MTTLTEVKEQLAKISEAVVRLEAEAKIRFEEIVKADLAAYEAWPKTSDGVFCLQPNGDITNVRYDDNMAGHVAALAQGSIFRTQEEAELKRERRAVMQKLRVLADFKPDWNNYDERKYTLYYCHHAKKWRTEDSDGTYYQEIGQIFFRTDDAALKAADTLGNELNVLFK
jgi:hypothetical protein